MPRLVLQVGLKARQKLYERAVRFVGTLKSVSAPILGRRLGVSIAKAEAILAKLADEKVVGPAVGVREVYVHIAE